MADDLIASRLEQPLADLSLVLDDLTVTPAGRRRVVRVVVDRDLGGLGADDATSAVAGLTLDEVAEATRVVADLLDEGDLMGEAPYTLEVSSPGLDRALRGSRQYRRNVGRLVAFVLESGDTLTARITGVSGDLVTVEQDATKKTAAVVHKLLIEDITSARVQVEFSRRDPEPAGDGGDGEADEDDEDDEDDEADEAAADDEETDDGH
ncbi:ribosome maturation factor RimP [Lapillicoccus sp.]|uniref:ribosome maturation factor RimP n=1 Tax=Lapillicoccus sp. TaxID=1909287 RepID=UPI0025D99BDC|nr:ribosome maturation factor RimP [Lapillicoccus sp.]